MSAAAFSRKGRRHCIGCLLYHILGACISFLCRAHVGNLAQQDFSRVIFRHVCSFVMSKCDLTPLFSSSHCMTACYANLSCSVLHDMVVLCVQVMVQG